MFLQFPILSLPLQIACRFRCVFLLLACLTLLSPCLSHAQAIDLRADDPGLSINAGIGGGLPGGLGLGAGAELWTRYGLWEMRLFTVREMIELFSSSTPARKNTDLSVLYGWRIRTGGPHIGGHDLSLTVSAGLGHTRFTRKGNLVEEGTPFLPARYKQINEYALGFVYELRIAFSKGRAGAQLGLYGNQNGTESYFGVLMGVVLGRLN